MNEYRSTRQAAAALGLNVAALQAAVYRGRVREPLRSPANDFLWSPQDIEAAAAALAIDMHAAAVERAEAENKAREDAWREEFAASPDLQAEFGCNVEHYLADRRHEFDRAARLERQRGRARR